MKNILIGLGLIILVIVGWTLFSDNTYEHVKVVDQEIEELESELASLETAVVAGTLTPEVAIEARLKIEKRLETISNSIQDGQKAGLTEAQKRQLNEGLDRLKGILVDYQSTLILVDEELEKLPEAKKTVFRKSGDTIKNLTEVVVETVTEVEETVSEIVEDYVATPIEELFEENLELMEEGDTVITSEEVEEGSVNQEEEMVSDEEGISGGDTEESGENETVEESATEDGQTEAEESYNSGVEIDDTNEEGTTTNQ